MTRRTVVIVLSDGWDTGDPTLLEAAMRRLHRETGRVIWLTRSSAATGISHSRAACRRRCRASTYLHRSTIWRAWRSWSPASFSDEAYPIEPASYRIRWRLARVRASPPSERTTPFQATSPHPIGIWARDFQ
jgi:hypothetical protein